MYIWILSLWLTLLAGTIFGAPGQYQAKNLLILWPERFNECSGVSTFWKFQKLASVLLDLESLAGSQKPSKALRNPGVWANINADTRRRLGVEISASPIGGKRSLGAGQCFGIDEMMADLSDLASAFMSQSLTAAEFGDEFGDLLDRYIDVIDGSKAGVDYETLKAAYSQKALVGDSAILILGCQKIPFSYDIEQSVIDLPKTLKQRIKHAPQLYERVKKCQGCYATAAKKILAAIDFEGDLSAALTRGGEMQKRFRGFHQRITNLIQDVPEGTLPQTVGGWVKRVFDELLGDREPFTMEQAQQEGGGISQIFEIVLRISDQLRREVIGAEAAHPVTDAINDYMAQIEC